MTDQASTTAAREVRYAAARAVRELQGYPTPSALDLDVADAVLAVAHPLIVREEHDRLGALIGSWRAQTDATLEPAWYEALDAVLSLLGGSDQEREAS